MTNNTGSTPLSTLRCLWLFPLAYLLHAIEEYRGVGALHGINLSPTEFLVLSSAAWLLMLTGIVLSKRYRFRLVVRGLPGHSFSAERDFTHPQLHCH
jgi:hypothetical protein